MKDLQHLDKLFKSEKAQISLLKIKSKEQKKDFTENFPNSFFISQIAEEFPNQLQKEVKLFFILILLFSFAILTHFFKNKATLCLLPAIGAVSGVGLSSLLNNFTLSFTTFIAMIILLGLTLDYGIFCTSHILNRKSLKGAYGAIALSAGTSIAGFSPLAFCEHPVLFDLGCAIVLGLLGALLVTFLIYPHMNESINRGQR